MPLMRRAQKQERKPQSQPVTERRRPELGLYVYPCTRTFHVASGEREGQGEGTQSLVKGAKTPEATLFIQQAAQEAQSQEGRP